MELRAVKLAYSHFVVLCICATPTISCQAPEEPEEPPKASNNNLPLETTEPPLISEHPTLSDIPYGPHPKQVLHLWKATSSRPTPLLFFLHGGSWTKGDRMRGLAKMLPVLLEAGISVVSAEYRFIQEAKAAGVNPPIQWPFQDAARALQFTRSKAREWNIDEKRIAASGGSAGGCMSLWLAYHDDLANLSSPDPVLRESTRLSFVAVTRAQTTLDPKQMKEWTPNSIFGGHAFGILLQGNEKDSSGFEKFLENRNTLLPWIREYSPYSLVSADDPPTYLYYTLPPAIGKEQEDPTHSSNFGVGLQKKLRETDVPCELVYPGALGVEHNNVVDYLIKKLK